MRDHHYRARLEWTGAKHGATRSYAAYSREYRVDFEGKPSLQGSADPVFRGDAALHNPEDLLVAAVSTCHMLSYLALCAREGIAVIAYRDEATATMTEEQGSGRFTSALLRPEVTLDPATDGAKLARAEQLHDVAREQCFIANSVNFPVEHEPVVRRGEMPGVPVEAGV